MLISLTMPQFGESITQARIVHWLKKEGDSVKEGESIVEMETEKAVFDYESPFRGKLVKILEGEDVGAPVGKEIAQFEVSEQDGKKYLSLGIGKTDQGGTKAALAPLIRSLAKEHGVTIEEAEKIPGTGPGGRITKDDFQNYLKGRGAGVAPVREGVKTIQISAIRARIAEKMLLSKSKIPHAGCSVDVDLSAIENWRASRKEIRSYLPFAMMAAMKALQKFPMLNSSWKEADGRRWIEQYEFVHIGIALSTGQGLMVPVIRNAQSMKFSELIKESDRLVESGRKGGLSVQELTGATFTVNNAGALGAVRTLQIIPHPQAAVLAINRVVRRPWVVGNAIEIRPVMGIDLAFDHRIVDGDQATGFVTEIAGNLENFDTTGLL